VDRNRRHESQNRLIADESGDHREHDGAGEAGQIAELSGSEYETRVMCMPPRVGIGQRRDQHRACMRRHVQTIGDQRQRTVQSAAHDLDQHHGTA
jgi:hypothetical protein